jgi:membrane-bound serine protease (ClpP class)
MKLRPLGAFVALLLAASVAVAAAPVYRLNVAGTINPISRDLVVRAIDEAERANAAMLIIELNTPGGLGDSMRDIIIAQFDAAIPIVVFVSPAGARAASAGALITLAADVAVMAPGTNIGAATPVALMGDEEDDASTTDAKAINDAAAFARSVAERRGRNVDWAEAAVREASSLSASEALEQQVIDLIVEDFDALLDQLDGYVLRDGRVLDASGELRVIKPTLRERLLDYLANPNIVYILFLIGLYGLIYEFFQPGIGFGLAAGGICLVLALLGLQVLPINVVGVLLLLFGVGLMVLDAFTPTNGILTTGGVVALVAGSFTLFDIQDPAIGLSWVTIVSMVGILTVLFVFVITKGLTAQRRRTATGPDAMVGRIGVAATDLHPDGQIRVRGETWAARAVGGEILKGDAVVVEQVDGRRLAVRRADGAPAER